MKPPPSCSASRRWFAPRAPSAVKLSTYECGEVPYGSSWVQFNIRFYVVALIFIIFDVEVALLYPWAVGLPAVGLPRLRRSVHLHRDSARRAGVPVEGGTSSGSAPPGRPGEKGAK